MWRSKVIGTLKPNMKNMIFTRQTSVQSAILLSLVEDYVRPTNLTAVTHSATIVGSAWAEQTNPPNAIYAISYWCLSNMHEPAYVSLGPAFDSKDGEYRPFYIQFSTYKALVEVICKHDMLERELIRLSDEGKLLFSADVFATADNSAARAHMETAMQNDLGPLIDRQLLMTAWYLFSISIIKSEAAVARNARRFFDVLTSEYTHGGREKLELVQESAYLNIIKILTETGARNVARKIVVSTPAKLYDIWDFTYSAWLESFVSKQCSILVSNFVTPSFSIVSNWGVIHGINKTFFTNQNVRDKFETKRAEETHRYLEDAHKSTLRDDGEPANNDFSVVDTSILEAMRHLESTIMIKDSCITIDSENLGVTLGSVFSGVSTHPGVIYLKEVIDDTTKFTGVMFDYCYALLCLHSLVGVVHNDLHAANMMLSSFNMQARDDKKDTANIMYGTDRNHTYLVEHDISIYGSVIDFGRCILSPQLRAKLAGVNLLPQIDRGYMFSIVDMLKKISGDSILHAFPALQIAIVNTNPNVFLMMTAIDFIAMSGTILDLLGKSKVHGTRRKLVSSIYSVARRIYASAMTRIMNNEGLGRDSCEASPEDCPHTAGHIILRDVFAAQLQSDPRCIQTYKFGKNDAIYLLRDPKAITDINEYITTNTTEYINELEKLMKKRSEVTNSGSRPDDLNNYYEIMGNILSPEDLAKIREGIADKKKIQVYQSLFLDGK